MPKELRMNVKFTHPETGELQPAILQAHVGQWVAPAPQFENEFNLKTVLD